jgi:UDP-3-O-acyl N-acetylglucosamine deacetylase
MTPLHGLKVLELARVLAGPWAGQTLADLGATVIKVESPGGDETRGWGPPASKDGTAAYFHSCNRGKQSIALDFRDADDLALVLDLVREADVVIENFKVGGLVKYGLDYASLSALNPKLIYCSVTGFGQDGPYAHRAGYDFIIQAMSGIMDITGKADGDPIKPGVAYADIFTGLYSVIAIQAALLAREKSGQGQHIDMALFDTQVGVLANQASTYLMTNSVPIMDGSSARFVHEILSAGVVDLNAPVKILRILKPVSIRDGRAFAEISPSEAFEIDFRIEFEDEAIGVQEHTLNMKNGSFVRELSNCRTFCLKSDVEYMESVGLALGGSLDNAIVVDGAKVLNPEGFRRGDECVRHKMLDALGDLALAGMPIVGKYRGVRAGHRMTNLLLRKLFATPDAFEIIDATEAQVARLPGVSVSFDDLDIAV